MHLVFLQLATTPQSGEPAPHSESNTPKQLETDKSLIRSLSTGLYDLLVRFQLRAELDQIGKGDIDRLLAKGPSAKFSREGR